jgi:hypothetical protein
MMRLDATPSMTHGHHAATPRVGQDDPKRGLPGEVEEALGPGGIDGEKQWFNEEMLRGRVPQLHEYLKDIRQWFGLAIGGEAHRGELSSSFGKR